MASGWNNVGYTPVVPTPEIPPETITLATRLVTERAGDSADLIRAMLGLPEGETL
jgi:hypothetical protein